MGGNTKPDMWLIERRPSRSFEVGGREDGVMHNMHRPTRSSPTPINSSLTTNPLPTSRTDVTNGNPPWEGLERVGPQPSGEAQLKNKAAVLAGAVITSNGTPPGPATPPPLWRP